MFQITKQNNRVTTYLTEFVADKETDITQLPTNVAPGSKCRVISTANVYVLNCSHQWIKSYNESGGSDIGGGSTPPSSGDDTWNDFPSGNNSNNSSEGEGWDSFT